ncbi:hypothetical protein EPA93_25630 [Ktedonosporobacter rubrisoli]|uniref:Uncharacterized protein n=1 Tax=Ktedonosporobacter rubrisoli TaxID=2509675 RepID=A0A4P6JW16_KTERU|nr:hypothetical protein [Ktedonosporobacter rubrisoli]QBD79176.1 hypothetical protein EPA93_25630 [Ktedonosporobacter rubrisoli]
MVVRVTTMVLRIAALLALILGILFWVNLLGGGLVMVHMLLGLIVTLAVWILGGVMLANKNIGLGLGAIVLGLIVLILGMTQRTLLIGSMHWLIQVIHLLLGLGAIGIGEAIAARYKRESAQAVQSVRS